MKTSNTRLTQELIIKGGTMLTTENQKTGSCKITDALEILNEAAQEKKEELKGLLTDKYSHLKQSMTAGAEQGKQVIDQAKDLAQGAIVQGEEKLKEVVTDADKRVHKDPWPFIAGAAAFSLLLGYVLGSKNK